MLKQNKVPVKISTIYIGKWKKIKEYIFDVQLNINFPKEYSH